MANEIKVPTVGESVTEVTIGRWLKPDGAQVEAEEIIAEIESDKASFELQAEVAGVLHHQAAEGETVNVGSIIGSISESDSGGKSAETAPRAPSAEEKASKPTPAAENTESETYASGTPSPAARKILDEKQIAPASVNGTGKDGRITKADAQSAKASQPIDEPNSKPQPQPEKPASAQPQPQSGERTDRRERMSTLRRTIARRLLEAKNGTAMLTTFNEVDMGAVMEMRKKYKEEFQKVHGIGLGFMSIFAKAVTKALKEYPSVNASIDGDDVIFHDYVDMGVAVSTPRGLVVPVVRDADHKSLAQIERDIADIAGRARDNKLTLEEMTGGTFTITNGGVFGSMLSTPILNTPQSAILGMHNIVERPMAVNGQVVIRPIMYVALSYDHRIIDGRESVSFLVSVKKSIEDPYRLFLEV